MATFEVTLVARAPQESTAPVLTVVDRLVVESINYTDELNRPGAAQLGCPIRALSDAVKERLVNLALFPSEVWIYADSTLVWAGEIQTLGMRGQTVELGCVGLLGYTHRMGVTSDLTYTATDQFTIAAGLVDHWQDQDYGDYGIDVSGVGTSGVTRDRTYLYHELHPIGRRLEELGAVIDGFDMHVGPESRELVLSYPDRGTDLTASVFFDERNIDSASVAVSVAPEDLVSDVSATGTSNDGSTSSTIYTARSTGALRATYGRSWGAQTFDGVSVQATLEGHADAFLATRDEAFFQPGVTIAPRIGCDIDSFDVGDTVSYSYDAGLGRQSGSFRVAKKSVTVDLGGRQRINVEFV